MSYFAKTICDGDNDYGDDANENDAAGCGTV